MKKFKQMDAWISIILIIVFTMLSLIRLDDTFLIGYFVVGGWQVISMIIHAVNGWFCEKGSKRYRYHWIVGITLLTVLLGLGIYPLLFIILLVLLFIAPLMAVWYCWLCYEEVYVKMQRPLSLLK